MKFTKRCTVATVSDHCWLTDSDAELGRGVGVTAADEAGGDDAVPGAMAAVLSRRVPSGLLPVGTVAGVLATDGAGSTR